MRKSHPVRRAVLATAATVSGIVLLLSLKPASDPGAAEAAGATRRAVGSEPIGPPTGHPHSYGPPNIRQAHYH
ncbi:FMN-binding protein, partial [Streptomyces sp. NPDC060077]